MTSKKLKSLINNLIFKVNMIWLTLAKGFVASPFAPICEINTCSQRASHLQARSKNGGVITPDDYEYMCEYHSKLAVLVSRQIALINK